MGNMTWTIIGEKHTNMKRCKPVAEGGCDQFLEKRLFASTYRTSDGRRRRVFDNWCKACQKNRREAMNKAAGIETGRPQRDPIRHPGPQGIERLYFCDLLPPAYSLELRAARLGL